MAALRRLATVASRRVGHWVAVRGPRSYGRRYSDSSPSRGPAYTTELSEATISGSSVRPLPVYRVIDAAGSVLDSQQDPGVREVSVWERGETVSPAAVWRDRGEYV